jgi:hypothetical protein
MKRSADTFAINTMRLLRETAPHGQCTVRFLQPPDLAVLLALRFTADTTMRIWCVNPNTMGDGTQTISPPGEPNCGNIASHKP